MMESRYELSYERTCRCLRQSLFLKVAPYVGEKLSSLGHLCHQAVEVVGFHRLIESDDIGMTEPSHELCLSQQVLADIVFLDFICLNNFDCHLWKLKQYHLITSTKIYITLLLLDKPQLHDYCSIYLSSRESMYRRLHPSEVPLPQRAAS